MSGKKAFDGETISDIVSAVLQSEPQWDALAAATPVAVQRLLRRCLVKDRKERIPDIGVARLELKEPPPDADSPVAPLAPRARAWRRLATYIATATAAALTAWWVKPDSVDRPRFLTRTVIELPGNELAQGMSSVALSPDGQLLVYVAEVAGNAQLFSRPMNSFEATPIPGTEGARGPFFSPDGKQVRFFTRESLKKVVLDGGIPTIIADDRIGAVGGRGTWADDDTIIFSTSARSGLARVSAGGGRAEILTTSMEMRGRSDIHTLNWFPAVNMSSLLFRWVVTLRSACCLWPRGNGVSFRSGERRAHDTRLRAISFSASLGGSRLRPSTSAS